MSQTKNPQQQPQRINLELGEVEAEGLYANLTLINQSGSEFVLDFARIMPGRPKAKVYARVIMAPPNAKAFLKGLEQHIKRFEDLHGPIGDPRDQAAIGFQSGEGKSN